MLRNTWKTVLVLAAGTIFSCLLIAVWPRYRAQSVSTEVPPAHKRSNSTVQSYRQPPESAASHPVPARSGIDDASPVEAALVVVNPSTTTPKATLLPSRHASRSPAPMPSPVDGAELRTADGYSCKTERMTGRPDITVVTFDDGLRVALSSDVAKRLLTAPGLTDEQKMTAMLSYPNLVEATSDEVTAAEVYRLEETSLAECPPDAVAAEIMETPDLRAAAFQVPERVQAYFDSLPQQEIPKGP